MESGNMASPSAKPSPASIKHGSLLSSPKDLVGERRSKFASIDPVHKGPLGREDAASGGSVTRLPNIHKMRRGSVDPSLMHSSSAVDRRNYRQSIGVPSSLPSASASRGPVEPSGGSCTSAPSTLATLAQRRDRRASVGAPGMGPAGRLGGGGRRLSVDPALVLHSPTHGLAWQGEPPKRFCVLRGSNVVTEKDVSALFSIYFEVLSLGAGQFTTDALKRYMGRLEANNSQTQLKFCHSISGVLVTKQFGLATRGRTLGIKDLFEVVYGRASPDEIEFLISSSTELRMNLKAGQTIQIPPLSVEDLTKISKIFNQLERTDNGYVALNLIIMKIVATFSDIDEPTILKQLSAAGIPRSHKALDLEGFQKFMAVNLSSHPCVSLDQWLGVLYGYEVVLGSVVRKGNANVQEVREEIEDYSKKKRTTKLTKLLGAIGIGRGGVEESGAVGDDS